jgi:D-alanine-D-alanine ligase
MLTVGFVFNLATDEQLGENPELVLNLTDPAAVIDAVAAALADGGHDVVRLNADQRLPAALAQAQVDMVFNIATGIYGDTRQANVPAMLEYLRIPHTGSGVLAETLAHHKHVMKTLLMAHDLPTPAFQAFQRWDEPLNPGLRFPLIAKLPSEGGSLGLDTGSVVFDEAGLRARIDLLLATYGQGALVEEYIEGREFTVPVLGNTPPYALPVVERQFFGGCHIMLDEPEETTLRELERLTGQTYSYTPTQSISVSPADLPPDVTARIQQISVAVYTVLGCRDWARIDLRMDARGGVYVIDVNLEPAIAPEYAMAKSAQAAGWTYPQLVNGILNHAIERYPQLRQPAQPIFAGMAREWQRKPVAELVPAQVDAGHSFRRG